MPDAWAYWSGEAIFGLNSMNDLTLNGHTMRWYGTYSIVPGKVSNCIKYGYPSNGPGSQSGGTGDSPLYQFDWVNDWKPRTIAGWFTAEGTTAETCEWYWNGLILWINVNGGQFTFRAYAGNAGLNVQCISGAYTALTWHFVVVRLTTNRIELWVDNSMVAFDTGGYTETQYPGGLLNTYCLTVPAGTFFYADEVGLWLDELSEMEMSHLWNNGDGRALFAEI